MSMSDDLVAELRAALGKMEVALSAAADSIAWTDERGRVEWSNAAFDLLVGHPRLEVLGANLVELLPLKQDGQPVSERDHPVRKVLDGQPLWGGTYSFRRQADQLWLELLAVRMKLGSEKGGVAITIDDSTDRRRAEEALEERNSLLEAVNKELEAFSYSVSHDLRAPLRAIAGFASVLMQEHSRHLNADGLHCVDVIVRNAKRMGQLIDDLLAFSRLQRRQVTFSDIDMNELARTALEELRRGAPDSGLRFAIHALAPAHGDRAMLYQVLVNLLSNAIKFSMPKGGGSIEVGSYEEEGHTIYYVRDTGIGFDMKYVDKLFGVFERLHGEQFEGSGVGLALVERVIHRHGGRVWAKSAVNQGATFYFSIPQKEKTEP